jgi:hypothetical protein
MTPDMHCSLSGAPLTSVLTSAAYCSCQGTVQSTVALESRCSAGAPDSPGNYSGARPQKPEGGEFAVVRSWCIGHCPVSHRTVRCARPGHTLGFFASFFLNPNLIFLLVYVEPLRLVEPPDAWRKREPVCQSVIRIINCRGSYLN